MATWESIEKSADEIQRIVDEYAGGWENPEARKKIKAEISSIRWGLGDSYISEKLASLEHDVDVLYSPRKAARWGGAEQVRSNILSLTTRIKDQARIRARAAGNAA